MKLNIAFPAQGTQKLLEIDDDKKLRVFWDKRISQDVEADSLGDQYKGYIFRIMGGQDKQGFAMKQGVLVPHRVRLLLKKGDPCYRGLGARDGARRRKSVRGCIVSPEISVLSVAVVKKGENEIPGLTDRNIPRRLGPKRASKIRRLFNLEKKDDVRKYVIRRELPAKEGKKPVSKAPKIQRLVTPVVLQRKRARKQLKSRKAAQEYQDLVSKRRKESKEKRQEEIAKRRKLAAKK